jgi:hypothetical protein
MARKHKATLIPAVGQPYAFTAPAPVAPAVVAPAPVVAPQVSTATVAAAKQARYAPLAVLGNANAVIASVAPNPKRGKSATRYAQFYKVGITVAEFVAAYKAANLPGQLARADLRWDLQHGLITLQG